MRETPWSGSTAMSWWAGSVVGEAPSCRRLSARLRRASSLSEILSEPEVFDLSRRLGIDAPHRIALTAVVLARVTDHRQDSLATLLGRNSVMSQMRFRKMMSTPYGDLRIAMRRALAMSGGQANVSRLAADLLSWTEDTRSRWCIDYHKASFEGVDFSEEDDLR